MEGTVDHLLIDSKISRLTEQQCYWIFKDCAKGINFIHNEIRGPEGEWMRVVHMAIRTANILYKRHPLKGRNVFKLADFEECIIYDRNFRSDAWDPTDPNSQPPDYLPDPNRRPYVLPISAPEICAAREDNVDRTHLRLMPNDVYCLSTSVAYCRVADESTGKLRIKALFEMLDDISTLEPLPEPNTLEHLLIMTALDDPNERYTITQVLEHHFLSDDNQF